MEIVEAVKHVQEAAYREIDALHAANTKMEAESLKAKNENDGLLLKIVCFHKFISLTTHLYSIQ